MTSDMPSRLREKAAVFAYSPSGLDVFLREAADLIDQQQAAWEATLREVDDLLASIAHITPDGNYTVIYVEEAREIIERVLRDLPKGTNDGD